MELVPAELIARARAGDGEAFRALTEPHRRELHVHCYRMLGSLQDAEDALQDTLVAAWQGLAGFEGRASIRTWLYRIATNRCLDALRSASRRPAKEWDIPGVDPPEPTGLGDVVWLEPYPDALLEDAMGVPLGPQARYEQTESVSLAFMTALQVLPPRQLAVLVLRDVLGFHANEVADMLNSSSSSSSSRHCTIAARSIPPGVQAGYIVTRRRRLFGRVSISSDRSSTTWRSTLIRRRTGSTRSAVSAACSPHRMPEYATSRTSSSRHHTRDRCAHCSAKL
jgi:RNA polymerase sigma factor (sigma-70 family)